VYCNLAIGLPHTVSETTGNEIPTRPYTLPLILKHTSCWENCTSPGSSAHAPELENEAIVVVDMTKPVKSHGQKEFV